MSKSKLFDDLEQTMNAGRKTKVRRCVFGNWLLSLAPEDAAQAEQLVQDRSGYNCEELATYFGKKGCTNPSTGTAISGWTLSRHRNHVCCGQAQLDA